MVDRRYPSLSVVRQCTLLDISRSGLYYQPVGISEEDLTLMKLIDCQYLVTPFYGARKIAVWLKNQNYSVNRKRVRRLMQLMGLKAIYRRPRTSQPAPKHKIYPYLLGGMKITRPNQVWAADITYIPMARGFLYLVAIIDWYSRYVLSRRRSGRASPISSILTKEPSSPAKPSPAYCTSTESGSAWMGRGVITTTCLSSDCGDQ